MIELSLTKKTILAESGIFGHGMAQWVSSNPVSCKPGVKICQDLFSCNLSSPFLSTLVYVTESSHETQEINNKTQFSRQVSPNSSKQDTFWRNDANKTLTAAGWLRHKIPSYRRITFETRLFQPLLYASALELVTYIYSNVKSIYYLLNLVNNLIKRRPCV